MLANHSHERLIALGLTGMAKAWDDQQQQPDADALTFELSGVILAANTNFILRGDPAALDMARIIVRRRLGVTTTAAVSLQQTAATQEQREKPGRGSRRTAAIGS